MANIYVRDEILQRLDKHCETPKGTLDRSDYIEYLLNKEETKKK